MQEELESLACHNRWELVDSAPAGARPIGTKWVFKIKKDGDGAFHAASATLIEQISL
jgi:hypothetical protein